MKTKQTKEAQTQENQKACVNAGQQMYGSQRRKPSQSQKIISLYRHRQKKEDAGKVGESREAEGSQRTEGSRELCVVCRRETEYARGTPISQRRGYIEGAGQLCRRCFAEIYADGQ